jgi:tetratricopeptide (TPR) repeat protein
MNLQNWRLNNIRQKHLLSLVAIRHLNAASICASFVFLCFSQASTGQASDPLTLGMQQYNSSNFAAAKTQLELAVKQHPTSAQLQYILGNTYFQLRNKTEAIKAYEACLALKPNPTVGSYCQKMLSHLKPSASVSSTSSATSAQGSDGKNESDPVQAKIEARRKEIMRRAEEECNKVRKETQAQIAEAEANGNRWTRYIEKNELKPTISKEERAAIDSESEQKITRIMDDARRQANSIASP